MRKKGTKKNRTLETQLKSMHKKGSEIPHKPVEHSSCSMCRLNEDFNFNDDDADDDESAIVISLSVAIDVIVNDVDSSVMPFPFVLT